MGTILMNGQTDRRTDERSDFLNLNENCAGLSNSSQVILFVDLFIYFLVAVWHININI